MGCSASAIALVSRKFRSLGLEGQQGLQALLSHTRIRNRIARGKDIVALGSASKQLTVLLEGIACSYTRLEDGRSTGFTTAAISATYISTYCPKPTRQQQWARSRTAWSAPSTSRMSTWRWDDIRSSAWPCGASR